MGMERRAERKDGEDTMIAAKARKPKGGANGCLVKAGSTPNTTLMQQALTRENLHLSRTMATQWGMNDTWLKSQGLVSIRDIWIAFHYPAANPSGIRAASR